MNNNRAGVCPPCRGLTPSGDESKAKNHKAEPRPSACPSVSLILLPRAHGAKGLSANTIPRMRPLRLFLVAFLLTAPQAHAQTAAQRDAIERLTKAVKQDSVTGADFVLDREPNLLLLEDGRVGADLLLKALSNEMLDRLMQSGANQYCPTVFGGPVSLRIRLPYLESHTRTLKKYDLVEMMKEDRVGEALEVLVDAPNLAHAWQAINMRSMLHEAARYGHVDLIDAIMAEGVDTTRLDKHGTPPITAVAWGVHTEAYRRMVDHHGIEPTLHAAAACAPVAEVRRVIKAHPEQLDAEGVDRATPLHYAIQADRPNVVALLLDSGASLFPSMVNGGTPLERAVQLDRLECAKVLLRKGADPRVHITGGNATGGAPHSSALIEATQWGSAECVRLLLEHDPTLVDVVDEFRGRRPLDAAASVEIVELLLKAGADPMPRYDPRYRKWHWRLAGAVRMGHEQLVRVMLEHGAPAEWPSREQGSLLVAATNSGFANVVALLLDHGAAETINDGSGHEAMAIALARDDAIIAELLVAAGFEGARDRTGHINAAALTSPERAPRIWGMLKRRAAAER